MKFFEEQAQKTKVSGSTFMPKRSMGINQGVMHKSYIDLRSRKQYPSSATPGHLYI
ncbi:hypothetical protein [Methanosarcina mazei]|uniref:hypothetical protein n=1 Tax=Methanosarcina mazei TaxID=2209 RepID=UPI000B14020F|nr:hypothetical protein [Methanosarcina mazei]